MEDKSLLLMDKEKADVKSTAFTFRSSKVRQIQFWISHCIYFDVRNTKKNDVCFTQISKFPGTLLFIPLQSNPFPKPVKPAQVFHLVYRSLVIFMQHIHPQLLLVFLGIDHAISTDIVLLLHNSVRGTSAEPFPHRLCCISALTYRPFFLGLLNPV